MKTLCRILAIVLVTVLFFSACKKDDDNAPLSKTAILTSQQWRLVSVYTEPTIPMYYNLDSSEYVFGFYDSSEDSSQVTYLGDIYDYYSYFFEYPCTMDNTRQYKNDNTFVDDEGGSKCVETDPQTNNGQWFLNEDNTEYTEIIGSETYEYYVEEITLDQFIVFSWYLEGVNDSVALDRIKTYVYKPVY